MRLTGNLALSLLAIVLLALGAIGFADKTEELINRGHDQTEAKASTDDRSADKSPAEHQGHGAPAQGELHNHDLRGQELAQAPGHAHSGGMCPMMAAKQYTTR